MNISLAWNQFKKNKKKKQTNNNNNLKKDTTCHFTKKPHGIIFSSVLENIKVTALPQTVPESADTGDFLHKTSP